MTYTPFRTRADHFRCEFRPLGVPRNLHFPKVLQGFVESGAFRLLNAPENGPFIKCSGKIVNSLNALEIGPFIK